MFTSVYETPFEDVDNGVARLGNRGERRRRAAAEENWPLFCKIQFEKGENGEQDTLALTRPAIIELQCFELMFKGVVRAPEQRELKSSGETCGTRRGRGLLRRRRRRGARRAKPRRWSSRSRFRRDQRPGGDVPVIFARSLL